MVMRAMGLDIGKRIAIRLLTPIFPRRVRLHAFDSILILDQGSVQVFLTQENQLALLRHPPDLIADSHKAEEWLLHSTGSRG